MEQTLFPGVALDQVEDDRKHAAYEKFRQEEGFAGRLPPKDLVDRQIKVGVMFGVGTDVRGTSSALFDLGFYVSRRAGRGGSIKMRMGALQRNDDAEEISAFELAATYTRRVLSTRRYEVALGAGPRFEVRLGDERSSNYNRTALDGDLVLELLPRSLPATLSARFQHSLTDEVRGSALLFELGFEAR